MSAGRAAVLLPVSTGTGVAEAKAICLTMAAQAIILLGSTAASAPVGRAGAKSGCDNPPKMKGVNEAGRTTLGLLASCSALGRTGCIVLGSVGIP